MPRTVATAALCCRSGTAVVLSHLHCRENATKTKSNNMNEEQPQPAMQCKAQISRIGLHPHQGTTTGMDLTHASDHSGANAFEASPPAPHAEAADRPLPARISFLAGPPRRRHLHGRALAPPPPTSASAPPSSSSSAQQPPNPVPSHHRALRRAPATSDKLTPLATPPPRLAPGETRSARRGLSWGRHQHPPPLTAGRGRHRRHR